MFENNVVQCMIRNWINPEILFLLLIVQKIEENEF